MIKIMFVCHGNICRSTMAESVFSYLANQSGLTNKLMVASAATSREEIGNGIHPGTLKVLKANRIPAIPHRARQLTADDCAQFDFLIGMDSENIQNMTRICDPIDSTKIYRLLDFTGTPGDVADPWYTGNFDQTYVDVVAGCKSLLNLLITRGKL